MRIMTDSLVRQKYIILVMSHYSKYFRRFFVVEIGSGCVYVGVSCTGMRV